MCAAEPAAASSLSSSSCMLRTVVGVPVPASALGVMVLWSASVEGPLLLLPPAGSLTLVCPATLLVSRCATRSGRATPVASSVHVHLHGDDRGGAWRDGPVPVRWRVLLRGLALGLLQPAAGRLAAPEFEDAVVRGGGEEVAGGVPGDHVYGLSVRVADHGVRQLRSETGSSVLCRKSARREASTYLVLPGHPVHQRAVVAAGHQQVLVDRVPGELADLETDRSNSQRVSGYGKVQP